MPARLCAVHNEQELVCPAERADLLKVALAAGQVGERRQHDVRRGAGDQRADAFKRQIASLVGFGKRQADRAGILERKEGTQHRIVLQDRADHVGRSRLCLL